MTYKKEIVILLFLLITVNIFALSPYTVRIEVKNELNAPINISADFLYKNGNEFEYLPDNWNQNMYDTKVWVYSFIDEYGKQIYKNKQTYFILTYTPQCENYLQKLDDFYNRPVKEQLKEIFKVFTITDENGKVLLTLDTIDNATIQYSDPEAREIYIVLDQKLYE